jgi:hypothetical protein
VHLASWAASTLRRITNDAPESAVVVRNSHRTSPFLPEPTNLGILNRAPHGPALGVVKDAACDFRSGCLTVLPFASALTRRRLLPSEFRFLSRSHCNTARLVTPAGNCDPAVIRRLRTASGNGEFELKIGRGPGI